MTGQVRKLGPRLRISTQLYDARSPGRPLRTAQADGAFEQLPELAQRVTAELAAQLGDARAMRVPTGSTAAMHLYVLGRRLMEDGRYDQAAHALKAAVVQDSSFAAAWYALSMAMDGVLRRDEADAAAGRAALLLDRLPRRAAALVGARAAYRAGDAAGAERLAHSVLSQEEGDAGGWFWLGETWLHWNPLHGRRAGEAQTAFEHVLARAPAHAGALMHLAELAARQRDWPTVRRLGGQALAAAPESPRAPRLALLVSAADREGRVDLVTLEDAVAGAGERYLVESARALAVDAGDLAGAARVLRLLEQRSRTAAVRAYADILLAQLELAQGRWRAALATLSHAAQLQPTRALLYEAALITTPGLPRDPARLRALRARLRALPPGGQLSAPGGPAWAYPEADVIDLLVPYLDARLTVAIGENDVGGALAALDAASDFRSLAGHYARITRAALDGSLDPLPAGVIGVAPSDALASPFFSLPDARYAQAERLARAGDRERASAWFAALAEFSIPDLVFAAPAHLRQADLAQALGRPREAAEEYRAFLALWGGCDPELRPLVRHARRALTTLVPS